jgi:hypothetical protein
MSVRIASGSSDFARSQVPLAGLATRVGKGLVSATLLGGPEGALVDNGVPVESTLREGIEQLTCVTPL